MGASKLTGRPVSKMWGRHSLPAQFAPFAIAGGKTGEIWFQAAEAAKPELLVKYLFTSERLSIQVHPDDQVARASGHPRGKDEAWLILDAEPGAMIALGLKAPVSQERLRQAALDGSIEQLVDWRPVRAGDFFYLPAGTIHALGGGLSLIEVQQNADLTYRLHDYGRPRPLHLDDALAAATLVPWTAPYAPRTLARGRQLLATGGRFTVERWHAAESWRIDGSGSALSIVALEGEGVLGGTAFRQGQVIASEGRCGLTAVRPLDLLVAYDGPVRLKLVRPAGSEGRRRVSGAGRSRRAGLAMFTP